MSANGVLERGGASDRQQVADLVTAAAAGDSRAWAAIVDRFSGLVWSVARAHRLGKADASDVSQVVWLRLVENLDRINEPDRLGAWLASVARNECLRVLRKTSRETVVNTEIHLDGDPDTSDAAAVDAGLIRQERSAALRQAIEALPDQYRALLRMLMSDPRPSYEEISAALDMPVGSIGPTRQRCFERLRRSPELIGISESYDDLLCMPTRGESA